MYFPSPLLTLYTSQFTDFANVIVSRNGTENASPPAAELVPGSLTPRVLYLFFAGTNVFSVPLAGSGCGLSRLWMFRARGSSAISNKVRFGDATEKRSSSRGATSISRYPGELKGGHVGVRHLRISMMLSSMHSIETRGRRDDDGE